MKWLLVTCFDTRAFATPDSVGVLKHTEAICAWSRDLLLRTIEAAQADGWDVLHAIVDCVWLSDLNGRSPDQQRADAEAFARRMSDEVGIPLEFEAHYEDQVILPSRMHGSGSLTKYWASTERTTRFGALNCVSIRHLAGFVACSSEAGVTR